MQLLLPCPQASSRHPHLFARLPAIHLPIPLLVQQWCRRLRAQQFGTCIAIPPPTGNGGCPVKALDDHGADGEKRTSAASL
jgi:hypothetical protein